MSRIYAILPVFNRITYTKECLDSFKKQSFKNFEVILVDSGSTDGTVDFALKHYPFVSVIRGNDSWWWTKAMYQGVKKALRSAKRGDYILEMNNDCHFGSGYLKQLLKTSKVFPKSLIGSICVKANYPEFVVESGIRIDWKGGEVYGVAWTWSNKYQDYRKLKIVKDLDALPGKGTLIPVEVFRKIGNFEVERLPHYIADYEFACRAKRAGWELLVDPRAVVKHHWEATGESSNVKVDKNSLTKAIRLLFGRRSMSNIIDWINFVLLACPKEYKFRNFYIIFWKILYSLFSIWPLYYLRPVFTLVMLVFAEIYHVLNILKLYLVQFPEYHLKWLFKDQKKK